jgi:hypothetical protein
MTDALRENWWLISLVVVAVFFAGIRGYRARHRPATSSNSISFATIRTLRPDELRPYFGVYRAGRAEIFSAGFLLAWLGLLAFIVTASFRTGAAVSITAVVIVVSVAAVAVVLDFTCKRVIGPDRIAFESPISSMSWSVPLSDVRQCDLVPGKPHNRLRVHAGSGSFTLPLTAELWSALEPSV